MMTTLILRALERIHGHFGWLAVAALVHPAIILRNPQRRAPLSVSLATAFVCVTGVLGAYVYPEYRRVLKQSIFRASPAIGWLFERKEHLAVAAVTFTIVGCIAHLSVAGFEGAAQRTLARLAHHAFVLAFLLAFGVAVLGVIVASFKSF
jgi:hypothetical protein